MSRLAIVLAFDMPWLLPHPGRAGSVGRAADGGPLLDCVAFETPRLPAGHSFTAAIGRSLEIRLRSRRGTATAAWGIEVGPVGTTADYSWVASPPFRTAPHRQIGDGYGVTARESVALTPRMLRFVTSAAEYDHAVALADRAGRNANAGISADDSEALGRGALEFRITGFGENEDDLSWISIKGRACQPR